MKRGLTLVALSFLLCATASAQGGGGQSTKKGSSKKVVTKKKNSGSTSGDAREPRLTADMKEQLVAQMVKDGNLEQKCIDDAGGIKEAIELKAIALSLKGQQYLMSGLACGFGANKPMHWVYEIRGGEIRMLADIGAAADVKATSRRTNGYRDIEISNFLFHNNNRYRSWHSVYMKYNGSIYE